MTTTSGTTFPLYGYERFFAMAPPSSSRAMLAHVLTLRGDVATLATHLPLAVLQTFNTHPRMRTTLLPGVAPLKAMVGSPLVDTAELTEQMFSFTWRDKEEESSEWMQFVEHQCQQRTSHSPYEQWPFSIRVFADKTTQRFARIIVFADGAMADAQSCAIVAKTLLHYVAQVSQQSTGGGQVVELPLQPSLYECMHNTSPWVGILNEALAKWVLQPLFQFDHEGFTPVLQVDTASQQDFDGKPPLLGNASRAFFATGTPANMAKTQQKCQEQGVSLKAATTAATIVAFALTQHNGNLKTASGTTLRVKTDASFDMRAQYQETQDAVGLYSLPGSLVSTMSQGATVEMSFWHLARLCESELREASHSHELKLQSLYVHETLTANGNGECGLQVKNCVLSDATIGYVAAGDETQPHEITLHKNSSGGTTTLHMESVHVYNALPSLSSACMVFVSGVTCFNYSMMAKFQKETATQFFDFFTQTMEKIGDFDANDSLLQASDKIVGRQEQEQEEEEEEVLVAPVAPMPAAAKATPSSPRVQSLSV